MRLADVLYAEQGEQHIPLTVGGFQLTIEYPKGSTRELNNDDGQVVYKKFMQYSYGYFNETKGRDGDEIDVILGPITKFDCVYVFHMKDLGQDVKEREDEDKIALGFYNYESAKAAFLSMYPPSFFDGCTILKLEDFRRVLKQASLPYREKKLHACAL